MIEILTIFGLYLGFFCAWDLVPSVLFSCSETIPFYGDPVLLLVQAAAQAGLLELNYLEASRQLPLQHRRYW